MTRKKSMGLGLTEQELKLTAVVYCRHGADEYLHKNGKLPATIGGPWNVIAMRIVLEERGKNPTLSPDEMAVYEAIVREGRLPGGAVRLVDAK